MAAPLAAHALLCQRRERHLEEVLQSLDGPDAVLLRVLAWERRNLRRTHWRLLVVEVLYRWILLRECLNGWATAVLGPW